MQHLLTVLWDNLQDHADVVKGTLGFVMAVTFPSIDSLNALVQFIGAVAGLFLLFYAIRHKMIMIKIDKEKLKKLQNGNDSRT